MIFLQREARPQLVQTLHHLGERPLEEPATAVVRETPRVKVRRAVLPMLLRYAAVVAFAFAAGYLTHGLSGPPTRPGSYRIFQSDPTDSADNWETRVALAYTKQPDRSGLARSLVALARAMREP